MSHATGYVMSFLAATIILHAGGIALASRC